MLVFLRFFSCLYHFTKLLLLTVIPFIESKRKNCGVGSAVIDHDYRSGLLRSIPRAGGTVITFDLLGLSLESCEVFKAHTGTKDSISLTYNVDGQCSQLFLQGVRIDRAKLPTGLYPLERIVAIPRFVLTGFRSLLK